VTVIEQDVSEKHRRTSVCRASKISEIKTTVTVIEQDVQGKQEEEELPEEVISKEACQQEKSWRQTRTH
jgi:hypothetical protein